MGVAMLATPGARSRPRGVLKLTLHATGYDWSFVPEAGGSLTDAGSAPCH